MIRIPVPTGRAAKRCAPATFLFLTLACCAPSSGRPAALIANSGSNHIQVVDLESGETLRRIHAGAGPWMLVPSPDRASVWVQHWTSGSTAVIDLASLQISAVHPYRGPGVFSPDGGRFRTFNWPDYALTELDPARGAVLNRTVTEIGRVAGLVPAPGGGLYLFQQDLTSPAEGPRYSYVLSYQPSSGQEAPPKSLPTGPQPEHLLAPPGQPFLLTADRGSDGITILNSQGDRRSLRVCEAPRRLALSSDSGTLAVGCWRAESGLSSEVVLLEADFSARPWPILRERARIAFAGALADLKFGPGDRSLYGLDEAFDRLIEWKLPELVLSREIRTGSSPRDLLLTELYMDAPKPPPPSEDLIEVLRQTRCWGGPFAALAWTESVRWREAPPGEGVQTAWTNSQYLDGSGSFRSVSQDGFRIAAGGWTYSIRQDGRFWRTPRQELFARVLTLQNLPPQEAIQLLAGDLPGGPFQSGGIATDIFGSQQTADGKVLILGASEADQPASQLWLDTATGAPVRLIERFQAPSEGGHGASGPAPVIDTRFLEWQTLPGGAKLPRRLERVIEGVGIQDVVVENARSEALPADFFDPARLGGVRPDGRLFSDVAGGNGPAEPMGGGYLSDPWAPHPPYSTNPPSSGPRLRQLASWGVHSTPVPLALQVHNLEHGGVIVQYNCERPCPELERRLESLARIGRPVIVAPYPYSDSRVTLTAWGRLLKLDEWDEERILRFIEEQSGIDHHDQ